VAARSDPLAACFHAHHANVGITTKFVEEADRIAAPSDAGDEEIRKAAFARPNLRARFASDDRLEVANHRGIGMRTEDGA
jgi:hypothetical protein